MSTLSGLVPPMPLKRHLSVKSVPENSSKFHQHATSATSPCAVSWDHTLSHKGWISGGACSLGTPAQPWGSRCS